jgi:hypothetical protein
VRKIKGHLEETRSSKNAESISSILKDLDGESVVLNETVVDWLPSNMLAIVTHHSRRCRVSDLKVSSRSRAERLCQLIKIDNPSADEIGFMESAIDFGLDAAVQIAARFRWACQRPLRALLLAA